MFPAKILSIVWALSIALVTGGIGLAIWNYVEPTLSLLTLAQKYNNGGIASDMFTIPQREFLARYFVSIWGVAVVSLVGWVVQAAFMPVYFPSEVEMRRSSWWIWWVVGLVSSLGVAILFTLLAKHYSSTVATAVLASSSAVFVCVFVWLGSVLSTCRSLVPAVPFGATIRRG